jgi:hypothetical protein
VKVKPHIVKKRAVKSGGAAAPDGVSLTPLALPRGAAPP